jgi:hypothetical protein
MLPAVFFMLPVVVVDVGGDRLDPSHTRELVAKELSVEAVAPDDPRASEATGRVEVVTSYEKLTVRYRKVDGPVERSIALAKDSARAEIDAAYLAGNLARDEASELVGQNGQKEKPAAPAQPASVVAQWNDDARDLAQMRGFLTQSAEEQKIGRRRAGITQIVTSAAFLAPATYLWTVDDASSEAKSFRLSATVIGSLVLLSGIGSLTFASGDIEAVAKRASEHEAKGTPAAETMADVEKEWAKRAQYARTARLAMGYLTIIGGGLSVALGGAVLAANASDDSRYGFGTSAISTGSFMIFYGAWNLIDESGIETSYRLWRTVKRTPDDGPRVSFGAAPLPGGGAASLTLRF